jgi:hypothetical protein
MTKQVDWLEASSIDVARKRRDRGIKRVLETEDEFHTSYRALAEKFLNDLPVGAPFTGETLRLYAQSHGVGRPHHPNVWGACASGRVRGWIKAKRVAEKGRTQAQDPKSHACSVPLYVKVQ